MLLPQFYIDDIIKKALEEDINYLDTATAYVIPENAITTAKFISKAEGVLCTSGEGTITIGNWQNNGQSIDF